MQPHSQEQAPIAVDMRGVSRRFPGVLANDAVDFQVREGEVHALLGENGAGKTTLMSILSGLQRSDEGVIRLFGEPVRFASPRDAIARGVGMVHQQFMLVPTLTVAENVVLGSPGVPFLLRAKQLEGAVRRASEEHGIRVEPSARVWQLSVGEQQRVEILKVLHRGARILILDEPTAVLAQAEKEALFEAVRGVARTGRAVVLITHKLRDVMRVADRCTVMRRGRVVQAAVPTHATDEQSLAEAMMGRGMAPRARRERGAFGEIVLGVEGLCVDGDRGVTAASAVSLHVRAGEILGIAGVAGSGQRELVEAIVGLRRARAGRVVVSDRELTGSTPQQVRDAGVGYVPEDRGQDGSVGAMSVEENMALGNHRQGPVGGRLWIDRKAMREQALRWADKYAIALGSTAAAAGTLSGGNLQKVILARELERRPRVLVASQPTRGLDVGSTEAVHGMVSALSEAGAAVLVVSEDLDELLALADRIVVMFQGKVVGEVSGEGMDAGRIGMLMGAGGA